MRNAHFFLLPIEVEAYGIVFLESLSFGLPVITHRICAVDEILVDERNGLLFSKGTRTEEVVKRITHLMDNPEKYDQMQRDCRDDFDHKYSPEVWAGKMIEAFKDCVKP